MYPGLTVIAFSGEGKAVQVEAKVYLRRIIFSCESLLKNSCSNNKRVESCLYAM